MAQVESPSSYIASILHDLYPDAYNLHCTVPIPSRATSESGILYRAAHTPLEHAAAENLHAVRWRWCDYRGSLLTEEATSGLYDILSHARVLYGAGMGLTSFGVFVSIIRTSLGLRWTPFDAANGRICTY